MKMATTDPTPITTKTLYHATSRQAADAILAHGFDLMQIKPRWMNDAAVSTTTSESAARRVFRSTDKVILRLKVRGRIYRHGYFASGPIQHAANARDYTRQMVDAGWDAAHLTGGTVYIYNPRAIQSVEEVV